MQKATKEHTYLASLRLSLFAPPRYSQRPTRGIVLREEAGLTTRYLFTASDMEPRLGQIGYLHAVNNYFYS